MGFCLPNVVLLGYLDTRSYPSVPALQKGPYTPSLHLTLILFFPSIGLCLFEPGGGKARFLTVELSMGQFVEDVKLSVMGKKPVDLFTRCGGNIMTPEDVVEKVMEVK